MLALDSKRIKGRVFPLHYPDDPSAYSGGFGIFVLADPDEVIVGGIENGPAQRAGVRWGDRIHSVNEVDLAGKSVQDLESIFASRRPERVRLKVERAGRVLTIAYTAEETRKTLATNRRQRVNGRLLPSGLNPEDTRCYSAQ
jgi:C-terminal processing protease CtpA/Prc